MLFAASHALRTSSRSLRILRVILTKLSKNSAKILKSFVFGYKECLVSSLGCQLGFSEIRTRLRSGSESRHIGHEMLNWQSVLIKQL